MEKTNKEVKYCGEIIDRSWFEDDEAYPEGTYYSTPLTFLFDVYEFYQPILRPNRIYLDEFLEQKELRINWLVWHKKYWIKKITYIARLIGAPYIVNRPEISYDVLQFEQVIGENKSDSFEHFHRRFLRRN